MPKSRISRQPNVFVPNLRIAAMASASRKVWNCDCQQYRFAGVWKISNIYSRKIRICMESLIGVLQQIQEIVWGPPTMILLLATGLYYTLRLGFLQFVYLPKAIRYIFEKEEGAGAGDVSAFASLCTALAATIGTGSIVGVATALRIIARISKPTGQ